MKKMCGTVVFFGNERLATGVSTTAPTLQALVQNGYRVAAVIANHEKARSRTQRELEIVSVAHAYHIPVLLPDRLNDIKDDIKNLGAEAAVLVAYGKIVPDEFIRLFPKGIINIHPSLLPAHRGPTPIESAMLQADSKTGVSLMRLASRMDSGPLFAQAKTSLSGLETKQQLADLLAKKGSDMLIEHLPAILEGSLTPQPQDESKATYDRLINKDDGVVDWSKPVEQIEREIRAFAGWPKSRARLAGKDVIINQAHATSADSSPNKNPGDIRVSNDSLITIACGRGFLGIDRLTPAGKNEMTSEQFVAGHKNLLPRG